ncbi:MAG: hypothetical protein F4X84_02980 [Synechococcus sp. SB0662_bin_45]|uniref:Uncharacterized protein n=1 Tax=Synechococcus sp. SB0676_bin_10 TaxID=2604869 RepID=A0A6B1F7A0_9SYNE|nr:hypothetical protein [Cyanobacteria bacterium MAG IRC3_bin_20]MDE0647314.1 hypothetical protein [Cyanobacteria bacterium MAG IRC4_bin_6]MXW12584.1 hypothetical protein [Synechococcus sp. SB0668_bin_13]MXX08932.1 hypothetical protein [Synechococcus sp. SB0667_bin_8]MYE21344.1 hypothetical protein [Synechococcus sp. SB0662_bin_45]MYG38861.1 hypothetical protein [Synechococcus sp. SB0676_bin_10]MYK07775.1 hypothetical protein [Synechococcus sp. SB0670_bin_20]
MVTRALAKALNKDRVIFLDPIRTGRSSSHHPHRPQRLLQDVTLALLRNLDGETTITRPPSTWRASATVGRPASAPPPVNTTCSPPPPW